MLVSDGISSCSVLCSFGLSVAQSSSYQRAVKRKGACQFTWASCRPHLCFSAQPCAAEPHRNLILSVKSLLTDRISSSLYITSPVIMAGFGFSIGDIILASSIALSIYNSSKQAGKEFRSIANDGELRDLADIPTLIIQQPPHYSLLFVHSAKR